MPDRADLLAERVCAGHVEEDVALPARILFSGAVGGDPIGFLCSGRPGDRPAQGVIPAGDAAHLAVHGDRGDLGLEWIGRVGARVEIQPLR